MVDEKQMGIVNSGGSEQFSLNKEDIVKILKGLGISAGSAALLAGASAMASYFEAIPKEYSFGIWQGVAITLLSTLANTLRKWATDTTGNITRKYLN